MKDTEQDTSSSTLDTSPVAGHIGRLLQHLLANWPRRGRTLLEVGCGDGVFLDMLWTLGFDVTGLDADVESLESAKLKVGARCLLQHGTFDDLPYDDHAFDYVVLVSVFAQGSDMTAILNEAVRVASRGVILIFPNRWSLNWLRLRMSRAPASLLACNPWYMWRLCRAACPGARARWRSILPCCAATWKSSRFWSAINGWLLPVPVGAYVGICLDMSAQIPLTGLPLLVKASRLLHDTPTVASSHSGRQMPPVSRVGNVPDGHNSH